MFESWKVINQHPKCISKPFFIAVWNIWILKSSCSLKSPTHEYENSKMHSFVWTPVWHCLYQYADEGRKFTTVSKAESSTFFFFFFNQAEIFKQRISRHSDDSEAESMGQNSAAKW